MKVEKQEISYFSSNEMIHVMLCNEKKQGHFQSFSNMCMYLVLEGQVAISFDERSIVLVKGDVCFVSANKKHQVVQQQNDALGMLSLGAEIIHHASLLRAIGQEVLGDVLCHHAYHVKEQRTLILRKQQPSSVIEIFGQMLLEQQQARYRYDIAMLSLLENMFVGFVRAYECTVYPNIAQNENNIHQLLSYLHVHCTQTTLESTAKHFGYHPNTISIMLQKATNQGFSELIRQFRMEKAKELLLHSDYSITCIAQMCGYQHMTHFYTLFKQQFDSTPHEYRKINAKERKS